MKTNFGVAFPHVTRVLADYKKKGNSKVRLINQLHTYRFPRLHQNSRGRQSVYHLSNLVMIETDRVYHSCLQSSLTELHDLLLSQWHTITYKSEESDSVAESSDRE